MEEQEVLQVEVEGGEDVPANIEHQEDDAEKAMQDRLKQGWTAAMADVIEVLKDRYTLLELKGATAEVSNT